MSHLSRYACPPFTRCSPTRRRAAASATGLGLALLLSPSTAQAQGDYRGRQGELRVAAPRLEQEAVIDGDLAEPAWTKAARLSAFSQYAPIDGLPAADSTAILVWYSPTAIHFGILAYEAHGPVNATLADRDHLGNEDQVQLLLGTFHDGRQAIVLGVNPFGIQMDGTLVETNQRGRTGAFGTESMRETPDLNPDFLFQSKGVVTAWGYQVEVRVPFKSLRYPSGRTQTWDFNAVRRVQHLGAEDSWAPARRERASFLQQGGTLEGLHDLRRGPVVDANPTISVRRLGSLTSDEWTVTRERPQLGGTVRWGVSTNVTLNATAHPDFSQVESDAGQFAFDPRQAVYVPEKRPFFLEGSEFFTAPNNLIYSRRIIQPEFASKLSARLGATSVGVLAAIDGAGASDDASPSEASRALGGPRLAIVRVVNEFSRSGRIGAVLTDRERGNLFNRVGGIDGRLTFRQRFTLSGQLAGSATRRPRSVTRDTTTWGPLWQASLARTGRRFGFTYSVRGIHPEFRTQTGFIGRQNLASATAIHRVTRTGAPGSVLQQLSFDPTLQAVWKYDRLMRRGDAIEKKSAWSVNATLRGGWGVGAGLLLETFGVDPDLYRGYRVQRGAGEIGPFEPTPRLFNRDYTFNVSTPALRRVGAEATFVWGQDENFDEWSSGDILIITGGINVRPLERLRADFTYQQTTVDRASDGSRVMRSSIPRLKVEYQVARPLFVRLVGEYNSYARDRLRDDTRTDGQILIYGAPALALRSDAARADFLLSYQPSPGTVFFLGYGNGFSGDAEPASATARRPSVRLERGDNVVFVKASYVWRM